LGAFLIAAALHLALASVGWFYRYEAYLVGTGWVLLLAALAPGGEVESRARADARESKVARGGGRAAPQNSRESPLHAAGACACWLTGAGRLALVCAALLVLVGWERVAAVHQTADAMAEIYSQQYQMARFVREYYPHAGVAFNDVGAVSYYSPGTHVVDLMGLAYHPIALARARGLVTKEMLGQVAAEQGASVAVVFPSWFRTGLPPHWQLVGTWKTVGAYLVVGADEVGFFALTQKPDLLRQQLQQFAPSLPERVTVTYSKS
jgi:hypothetical protein